MASTKPAYSKHTVVGTLFAAALTAYVVVMMSLHYPEDGSNLSSGSRIFSSAFVLALFFGKLHDHAVYVSAPVWLIKPIAALAYTALFVAIYPYIKFGMHYVFGL